MAEKKHILITGGAGMVAGILRNHWGDQYRLRLADIQLIENPGDHESVLMDITRYDQFLASCEGIRASHKILFR